MVSGTEYSDFKSMKQQKEEENQMDVDEVESHKKTKTEVVDLQNQVQSLKAANKIHTKKSGKARRHIINLESSRQNLRQQVSSAQKELYQSEGWELTLKRNLRELRSQTHGLSSTSAQQAKLQAVVDSRSEILTFLCQYLEVL